jgi:hypothetical protein
VASGDSTATGLWKWKEEGDGTLEQVIKCNGAWRSDGIGWFNVFDEISPLFVDFNGDGLFDVPVGGCDSPASATKFDLFIQNVTPPQNFLLRTARRVVSVPVRVVRRLVN